MWEEAKEAEDSMSHSASNAAASEGEREENSHDGGEDDDEWRTTSGAEGGGWEENRVWPGTAPDVGMFFSSIVDIVERESVRENVRDVLGNLGVNG